MAYCSVWDNTESPYFSFSQLTSSAGLDDVAMEGLGGDPSQWQNRAGQASPTQNHFSPSLFPFGFDDLTSTAYTTSDPHTQGQSRHNPGHQHAQMAIATVSPGSLPAEALQNTLDSPGTSDLPPGVELVCLHCSNKTFGRKADKDRHDKEQHQCPHRRCKGRWFSVEARRLHMSSHGNINVHFKCGSCDLVGKHKSIFKRCEKLKNHFAAVHDVRTVHSRHQCFDPACYDEGLIGGIYFVSREDYKKHFLLEHNLNGPDVNISCEAGSSREITKLPGNNGRPSPYPPNHFNLQHSVGESTSPGRSPREELVPRARQSFSLDTPFDESPGVDLESYEGGRNVGRVLDCDNDTMGMLVDWDQCDLVFIPMPSNTLRQRRQILPVRRRPVKLAPGYQGTSSQENAEQGWNTQSRDHSQAVDPAEMSIKGLFARKCPRSFSTISSAFGCPRANKGGQGALSRSTSGHPTSKSHSGRQDVAYVCPTKRRLDIHQDEPDSAPTWSSNAVAPLASPRNVGKQSREKPYLFPRGSSRHPNHDGAMLTPVTSAPF